ncbi:hypothetical protein Tco_0052217 [Tanacetum coccineum]
MNEKAAGMDKEEVSEEPESTKVGSVEIHSLLMKRFKTTPPEGIDLLLWGDLRIMFESKEDYELWKNQEEFIEQQIDEFGGQDGSEKDL